MEKNKNDLDKMYTWSDWKVFFVLIFIIIAQYFVVHLDLLPFVK